MVAGGGRAHGKRRRPINAASDRYFLSSLVGGKLKVKMIGLVLLTVLGAAGSTHSCTVFIVFRYYLKIEQVKKNNAVNFEEF